MEKIAVAGDLAELVSLINEESGNSIELPRFLYNEFKSLPEKKQDELLCVTKALSIKEISNITLLIKASLRLNGEDSLLLALQIKDNYLREILYNKPCFSDENKITAINNASKKSEGTHIIKYGNLFLNTEKNGNISQLANVSGGESRALGLFTSDMQFVKKLDFEVEGISAQTLGCNLESTNNGYSSFDVNVYGNAVKVKRSRIINGALFERLEISNITDKAQVLKIKIACSMKDVFEVRGKVNNGAKNLDILSDIDSNIIINSCQDSGDIYGLKICFNTDELVCPHIFENEIVYMLNINAGNTLKVDISYQPILNGFALVDGETISDPPISFDEALNIILNSPKSQFPKIHIDGSIPNMQGVIDQCISDLNMLVSYISIDGKSYSYIDAGLPRYAALFGRDCIITALETLPLNSELAKDTLELLAKFQGQNFEVRHKTEIEDIRRSSWPVPVKNAALKGIKNLYTQREEANGKILHELRVGELAKTGAIPHSPYYGSVDATPLWLILFCKYAKYSKDERFIEKYLKNACSALEWIEDNTINGYLRFSGDKLSLVKIQNQGWKDAGDSIRHNLNHKGFLCDPEYPIALAEVQGYVYRAYIMMAELFQKFDKEKSCILQEKAEALKLCFNTDFWIEDNQFYSMALDANNSAVMNITSNIGHCLSMGIVADERKNMVENRLMGEELFTGWGIRTLSHSHSAYDPISYHNGSVWVHDSALCSLELSKDSLFNVTKAIFEAANTFDNCRLPELYSGLKRGKDDSFIQPYPEACSPQAWTSGALIMLLLKIIKMNIEGENLSYSSTSLPEWIDKLVISNIKIGSHTANLEINNIQELS